MGSLRASGRGLPVRAGTGETREPGGAPCRGRSFRVAWRRLPSKAIPTETEERPEKDTWSLRQGSGRRVAERGRQGQGLSLRGSHGAARDFTGVVAGQDALSGRSWSRAFAWGRGFYSGQAAPTGLTVQLTLLRVWGGSGHSPHAEGSLGN